MFPTRNQVSSGTPFVWALDTHTQILRIIYDFASSATPVLRGVDNLTVSPSGQLLVAEDGGDMQLVVLDANGNAAPLLQVDGQSNSEITGPALSPDGTRLYFSSLRGPFIDGQSLGVTYEVAGPFSQILR